MMDPIPTSTRVSPYYPTYNGDEGLKQSNPQSKYQPWTTETSKSDLMKSEAKQGTEATGCKKYLTLELFMSILVGLVICGIPLAVVASLYVQKSFPSSSGSSSDTSGSSSGSSGLPSQCYSYTTNADATRFVSNTACINCIPDTSTYLPTGWYRFIEGAGTRLVTVPPSSSSCGASYPGWFNGSLPTTVGSTTTGTVCINVGGNLCHTSFSIGTVPATNCNGFYVFYLTPLSTSIARYCTTN